MKERLIDINAIEILQLPVHIEHVGDLAYYEGPLMSVYKDGKGAPFIYSWVESSSKANRWIVYETTRDLLSDYLFENLKDIELINHPVSDIIFIIDVDTDGRVARCFVISPKNLPEVYLPDHKTGFYDEDAKNVRVIIEEFELDFYVGRKREKQIFDVLKEAEKCQYEIINIHIHSKEGEVGYGRIRSSILGEILTNFSKMSKATALNIFDERKNSKIIEDKRRKKGELQEIIDLAEYEFVRADAASFNVILRPIIASNDMFSRQTVAERINNQLFELFKASSEIEELKLVSDKLSQEMLSAYNSFLKEIKERDISLDINYGNPYTHLKQNENFDTKKATRIIDNLKNIDFADSMEVKLKGTFKALDAITCTFKFMDLKESIYIGKFYDQLKDGVFQFNLKNLYSVTLEIKRTKKSGIKDIKEDIVMVACVEEDSSRQSHTPSNDK